MPARWPLREAVARLEQHYGTPTPLLVTDPFELVLWECCAYLVDAARRANVFDRLRQATGAEPERIAAMRPAALAQLITREGGMQPCLRAEKLQRAADIALTVGLAKLCALCRKDPARAKPLLRQFPGIGGTSARTARSAWPPSPSSRADPRRA